MEHTLGEKLRILRQSRDYTQQQVSSYLHMERAAYANYESGKRIPSYRYIVRIADFYGVRVDYLVRDNFSGNPRKRSCRAEQILEEFCLLEPKIQEELAQYIHYRASVQRAKD